MFFDFTRCLLSRYNINHCLSWNDSQSEAIQLLDDSVSQLRLPLLTKYVVTCKSQKEPNECSVGQWASGLV